MEQMCKPSLWDPFARPDTRILKMAEFEEELGKHRADAAPDPDRSARGACRSPLVSPREELPSPHGSARAKQGACLGVCQACGVEGLDGDAVQHEV